MEDSTQTQSQFRSDIMEKECFKCHRVLPLDDFYRHSQMADGHLGKCKECARADVAANRAIKLEYYHAFDVARFQRPERKAKKGEYDRRHNKANPDKHFARNMVHNYIRDGKLQRLPCQVCGCPKSEAHHTDYSKPLEVEWLCFKHHREAHGQTILPS